MKPILFRIDGGADHRTRTRRRQIAMCAARLRQVRRRVRFLPVLAAVAVLAASLAARFATTNAHADVLAVLQASVGPDFVISLKNPDGSLVGHLDAGSYEIQVADQATNHNYHLEGPGVSMATGVPDVQTADWAVTLGDGLYTYHCDQHLSLSANFAVGTATLAPPPAPAPVLVPAAPGPAPKTAATPAVSRVGGTLRAALAGTKLTLTLDGRRLTTLPAGTYKLVAIDTSKTLDLSLAQTRGGVTEQPLTTAKFTGTKTVTVDLLAGRWKLYSAVGKSVTSSFTVTR
jgi:hypothetical protein